jgi:long-chain fatty acid transport protein
MKRALVLATILASAATAHAGGVGRPFNGSAASSGMGGAFGAIADDPSCLVANPGGCGFDDAGGLVSLDVVYAPRSYVPLKADGTMGPAQDAAAVAPAPTVGFLFRPGPDSHIVFGVGAWNSFGGTIHWDSTKASDPDPTNYPNGSLDSSTELVFEAGLGAAWAIDDHVSVGATARLGLGLFGVTATQMPANADLSANGVGIGAGAGVLVKATNKLSFGLAWKSDMDVKTTGSGTFQATGQPSMDVDVVHVQHWPQSFTLATAFHATTSLTVAAQVDWVQWSRFESLDIHFPGSDSLDQHFVLDWSDSITARVGVSMQSGKNLTLRGGLLYDSNSVPDRTIARQYLDGPKVGVSAGASVGLSSRLILDVAADAVAGPTRHIADNTDMATGWPEQQNDAPGDHSGQVFTLTTGLRFAF